MTSSEVVGRKATARDSPREPLLAGWGWLGVVFSSLSLRAIPHPRHHLQRRREPRRAAPVADPVVQGERLQPLALHHLELLLLALLAQLEETGRASSLPPQCLKRVALDQKW